MVNKHADSPSRKWSAGHWQVLLGCYTSYMTKTFGEACFDLTIPARQLLVLGGSDAATGTLLSVGMGCYMSGKILFGQLGDILGGQLMLAGSLFMIGLSFVGISLSTKLSHLCLFWGLANCGLACPWTGMVMCCTPGWFTKANGLGTVVPLLGTGSRIGVLLSNSILGPMLAKRSWNRIIQIGAAVYMVGAAIVMAFCRAAPKKRLPQDPTAEQAIAPSKETKKKLAPMVDLLRAALTSPRILLIFSTSTLLNPIFCSSSILPLYLTQAKGMTDVAAATLCSAFPAGAMISIVGCTLVWDKLKEKGRWLWCALSLLLTITSTGLIGRGLVNGRTPMFIALTAVTAGMSSTWSVVGTEFVQVFGGSRAGTLTSWLDAPGYCLTTYFFSSYPRVLARAGWPAIWFRLQLFGTMALVCVSSFYFLESKKRTLKPHPLLEL